MGWKIVPSLLCTAGEHFFFVSKERNTGFFTLWGETWPDLKGKVKESVGREQKSAKNPADSAKKLVHAERKAKVKISNWLQLGKE